jgi:cytochrome b involved in lipid metabolism
MMRSTLRFLLVVVALVLSDNFVSVVGAQEENEYTDFFYACSGGKVDEVKAYLQKHPGMLHIF